MLGNQQSSSLIPPSSSDIKLKKRVNDMPDLTLATNNNSLLSPALLINQQSANDVNTGNNVNGSNKRSRNTPSARDYLPTSFQLNSPSSIAPCNGFFDTINTDMNLVGHGSGLVMAHPLSAAAIVSSKVAGINACRKSPFDTVLEGTNQAISSSSSSNMPIRNLRKSSTAANNVSSSSTSAITKENNANKGLRHFSAKVCAKVEEKGCTTYNEVADELVQQLSSSSTATLITKDLDGSMMIGNGNNLNSNSNNNNNNNATSASYDHKNIRRRVYDALNVLMAIDIITKDRKEIRWLGLPDELQQDLQRLETEERELEKKILEKKKIFRELVQRLISLRNLVKRNGSQLALSSSSSLINNVNMSNNSNNSNNINTNTNNNSNVVSGNNNNNSSNNANSSNNNVNEGDNLQLPFVLINAPKDARVHCEMLEDRTHYFFQFDAPFFINEDIELMRLMGLHRITEDELSKILSCNEVLEAYLSTVGRGNSSGSVINNSNNNNNGSGGNNNDSISGGRENEHGHDHHDGHEMSIGSGVMMAAGGGMMRGGGGIFDDSRDESLIMPTINGSHHYGHNSNHNHHGHNHYNRPHLTTTHSNYRKRNIITPPSGGMAQRQLNNDGGGNGNGNIGHNIMVSGNNRHNNGNNAMKCDGKLAQLGNLAELDQIGELDRLVSDDSHHLLFSDELYNNDNTNRQHQNRMNFSSPSITKHKR